MAAHFEASIPSQRTTYSTCPFGLLRLPVSMPPSPPPLPACLPAFLNTSSSSKISTYKQVSTTPPPYNLNHINHDRLPSAEGPISATTSCCGGGRGGDDAECSISARTGCCCCVILTAVAASGLCRGYIGTGWWTYPSRPYPLNSPPIGLICTFSYPLAGLSVAE
jgi:hypothetical protein